MSVGMLERTIEASPSRDISSEVLRLEDIDPARLYEELLLHKVSTSLLSDRYEWKRPVAFKDKAYYMTLSGNRRGDESTPTGEFESVFVTLDDKNHKPLLIIKMTFYKVADRSKPLEVSISINKRDSEDARQVTGIGVQLWRKTVGMLQAQADITGRSVRDVITRAPINGLTVESWDKIFLPFVEGELHYARKLNAAGYAEWEKIYKPTHGVGKDIHPTGACPER